MPRAFRAGCSGTRGQLLGGDSIEVIPQAGQIDSGSVAKRGHGRVGAHETMPVQRGQLSARHPVTGDDERLALVQPAPDLSTVVSQLSLTDLYRATPDAISDRFSHRSLRPAV